MDILDNRDQWLAAFEAGWFAHYQETGESNWKIYNQPRNSAAPSGPGLDLAQSRLLLISSAGAYLKDSQTPYDDEDDLGDYTIRKFPISTPPGQISFSHSHYDHAAVEEDQQVLLPLAHLRDLEQEGIIGSLVPSVVSFMGFQPVVTRLLDETIPAILAAVRAEEVDAILLVPS